MFPQPRHLKVMEKKFALKASSSLSHTTLGKSHLFHGFRWDCERKIFFFCSFIFTCLVYPFVWLPLSEKLNLFKKKKKGETEYLYSQHYFEIWVKVPPFYSWNIWKMMKKRYWLSKGTGFFFFFIFSLVSQQPDQFSFYSWWMISKAVECVWLWSLIPLSFWWELNFHISVVNLGNLSLCILWCNLRLVPVSPVA